MDAALSAFLLVLVAELGDKTMLLAAAFAARYRPWPVIGGVAIAAFVMLGAATLVGAALGAALPQRALAIGGGLLFLGFGAWTLRPESDDEDGHETELRGRSVLIGVTVAFMVAELGDKSQLATIALAGNQSAVPTWLGASLAMTLASGLVVALATVVGSRLPDRVLRYLAAAAFLLFGVLLLIEGIAG